MKGLSLVVQWENIYFPMQGVWVWSLVEELQSDISTVQWWRAVWGPGCSPGLSRPQRCAMEEVAG